MAGQGEIDGRVQPVAGVVGRGRQPRRLAQHQRRLLGQPEHRGIGQHVDRRRRRRARRRPCRQPLGRPSMPNVEVRRRSVRRSTTGVATGRAARATRRSPGTCGVAIPDASTPGVERQDHDRRPTPAADPGSFVTATTRLAPACRRAAATTSAVRPEAEIADQHEVRQRAPSARPRRRVLDPGRRAAARSSEAAMQRGIPGAAQTGEREPRPRPPSGRRDATSGESGGRSAASERSMAVGPRGCPPPAVGSIGHRRPRTGRACPRSGPTATSAGTSRRRRTRTAPCRSRTRAGAPGPWRSSPAPRRSPALVCLEEPLPRAAEPARQVQTGRASSGPPLARLGPPTRAAGDVVERTQHRRHVAQRRPMRASLLGGPSGSPSKSMIR